MLAADRPDWATDGKTWPNRDHSQFLTLDGQHWHVQIAGAGPDLLLLHGTGAATHSWAGLLPRLATHHRVIAPDLPGHGFTDPLPARDMSPAGMARAIGGLLAHLGANPRIIVGHSAGAAIAVRLALDGFATPDLIVALNGVILPLSLVPMHLFAPVARWLAASGFVPRLFAFHAADRAVADRLLRGTGSAVPRETADIYAALFRRAGHAAGALNMMAHWDLAPTRADLPRLATPLLLIVGENDRTVPPEEAGAILRCLPTARRVVLPGLGHLAHEEAPASIAALIEAPFPA